jgi:Periplasmic copper-binding protein (NosD)
MKYIAIFLIITIFCWSAEVMATDYYVNPTGNDLWSGILQKPNEKLTDGPFKTIGRTKQAIRALKRANIFNDKVTVTIATGVYYLSHPLNFDLMDSGFAGREILWQGEAGSQVTISGGMPITCEKRDATFWDCSLTQLPVTRTFFNTWRIKGNTPKFELYVNGQKLKLARWPDQDWAHIKVPLDQKTQFSVMEILPTLIDDIEAAQVHIFAGNDWYDQYIGIASVNQSNNSIKLSAPTVYSLASGRRFYIQNLPSLLNAPGEWIYDAASKKITFIPPEGMTPTEAILSSLPNILIADGVSYVTFKNISFQHSTGTAITVKNGTNIVMDKLNVNSVGGKGVEIKNGRNVQLKNSKIHHTGADGIDVSGGDRNTLQSSGHSIHNNQIHHISTVIFTYQPGIRLSGVGTKVTHNLLEQGAGTAILLEGNDHLIEKNELHHFCLQASDCGAIYSGRDWSWRGNVIRNNYIHDIIGYGMTSVDVAKNQVVYKSPEGARGVFLDDGASGFEVSGNIFENAGVTALLVGGGRDNKIYNNYFLTSEYAIWIDNRWPTYDWNQNQKNLDASPYQTALWQQKYPKLSATMHNKTWPEGNRIERNIIVTTKPSGLSFRYFVPMGSTIIADNLIWSTTGKLTVDYKVLELNKSLGGASWSQWMEEKIEQGSIVDDPCVTIRNKKMTTCLGSPINDIGFIPLPTDIGLINNYSAALSNFRIDPGGR